MDRIICDICGTEYEGTAERCPICSYPRQGNEKLAAAAGTAVRTKVKGGRFSTKNVKKRRKAQLRAARADGPERSDRGLWITIILLLAAIVLVSGYIILRFWNGRDSFAGISQPPQTNPTTTAAAPTGETTVPCGALVLESPVVELEELGQQVRLAVRAMPENTTDVLSFDTADLAVAQVDAWGVVTAVGPGQTTITITCGDQKQECTVICWFQRATQPPETTAPAVLSLDHTDVSFFQPGEAFTLKVLLGDDTVSRSEVTWTSSMLPR